MSFTTRSCFGPVICLSLLVLISVVLDREYTRRCVIFSFQPLKSRGAKLYPVGFPCSNLLWQNLLTAENSPCYHEIFLLKGIKSDGQLLLCMEQRRQPPARACGRLCGPKSTQSVRFPAVSQRLTRPCLRWEQN